MKRSDVQTAHSSETCEQIESLRTVCSTVLRPSAGDIDAALSTPFEEDTGLRDGGDSASGDEADERRTTAPGRDVGAMERRPGEEVADTPISTRLCSRRADDAGLNSAWRSKF